MYLQIVLLHVYEHIPNVQSILPIVKVYRLPESPTIESVLDRIVDRRVLFDEEADRSREARSEATGRENADLGLHRRHAVGGDARTRLGKAAGGRQEANRLAQYSYE